MFDDSSCISRSSDQIDTRIPDPTPVLTDDGNESLTVWGFDDTQFQLTSDECVEVTGNRYSISGLRLPSLLSWMENILQLEIPRRPRKTKHHREVEAAKTNPQFLKAIEEVLDKKQITHDQDLRARHGHGHSQTEIYAVNYARLSRTPDLVLYPESESQVDSIVRAAIEHGVCLIPYGGGTNVSEALLCPENESRMIVSVDMQRMNRIQWIDPVNRLARIEAGATGRRIDAALARHSLTMGHEPDSIEFSTLGGWISTNASGMKKNKYGNIEDIVIDVNVVTADGLMARGTEPNPRESTGCDPIRYIFSSEGNLGVITSAVVKLSPLPTSKIYGSILFPSFDRGLSFMYDLAQANAQPASVRLADNLQFQLSQVFKPATTGIFARLRSWLERVYVLRVRGFDPERMVACTLVSEGMLEERPASSRWRYIGSRPDMPDSEPEL